MPVSGRAILLDPFDAVYVDIAKVASSSLKATFADLLGLDGASGNPHEIMYPEPGWVTPSGERIYPEHFAFAFVRDPWDRLVSCYRDKIRGEVGGFTGIADSGVAHCLARFDVFAPDMSFVEFVRAVAAIPDHQADEHFRSQADYVTNEQGDVAVDFVGRYERLAADFADVAAAIGLPVSVRLPRLQAAPAQDHARCYDAETSALVAARYARDIGLFGYSAPAA